MPHDGAWCRSFGNRVATRGACSHKQIVQQGVRKVVDGRKTGRSIARNGYTRVSIEEQTLGGADGGT